MTMQIQSPALAAPARFRSPFAALVKLVGIHRERRSLDQLDAALLKDIGVSRDQARQEAARPAWDAPSRWCA